MTERRVSVRLGVIGGKEVEAEFVRIGQRGSQAMNELGQSTTEAFGEVERASGAGGHQLQNVYYQIQDFAVQVGGGTSATQALAQQLPQLLSAFGIWGVVAGTVAAVMIPLGKVVYDFWNQTVDATKAVETLNAAIGELKRANAVYSTTGIQGLIDKYGEANAAVLLLIERQQTILEADAFAAAQQAVASLGQELEVVSGLLSAFDNFSRAALTMPQYQPDADSWKAAIEDLGLTVDQARELMVVLEQVRASKTLPEMAEGAALLNTMIEGTTLATRETVVGLLEAEDALRQLNAEGTGVNSWLDFAVQQAGTFAARLWDAARASAAARAATTPAKTQEQLDRESYALGQAAVRDRMIADRSLYGGNNNGLTDGEERTMNPPELLGAAAGSAGSRTNDLEREAGRIFDATRTKAEQYAAELARLEEIKAAGLISGDTYNRQLDALAAKYDQQGSILDTLQEKLADFAEGTRDIAAGIGDALVEAFQSGADAVGDFVRTGKLDFGSLVISMLADMAKLAAQKYIMGPLAGAFSGMLSGLFGAGSIGASILHEGSSHVGGGGTRRSVPAMAFAGAPRFHNGVNLGLRSDEVPAILQRGERVLSRAQNRGYSSDSQRPTVVNFNVKDAASIRQSRAQMAADAARIIGGGGRNR